VGVGGNRPISRRDAIALLGAAGAGMAVGCGNSPTSPSSTTTTTTAGGSTAAACAVTPSETVGPFPSRTDLIRSDIREGKPGTTLALTITVVDAACAPVANATVDIWQCDHAGNYSEYGSETSQTYLRGVQTTNGEGQASFTTVYPGWYQGRATHIHVEVLRNGSSAKVTQIAFPESVNAAVYGTGAYASRGANPTSNIRDGIFADSLDAELATISGDPAGGYRATFRVAIPA